ncbi:MAG: uxuR [Collimonas fungivorans]|uniref:FadR/GntR family transcriptional regulator n=1 Tax=Collimonas fungivorans TaxID=158899 RepID=UPI0026EBA70B|nr:FadR/GntR family transcriptional regulator [Collimonas fungivorans]MDB5769227.1 uxuR [Collimonas fungivorans]
MPIQVIHNRRLYQQIADQLRDMIDRGEYGPGDNLPPERELAKQFGVSRTSVREALIALEVIGVVSVRVGNGVMVLPRTEEETAHDNGSQASALQQAAHRSGWEIDPELDLEINLGLDDEIPPFKLLQARRLVEPETAALAAVNASDEQLRNIAEAYARNVEDNRSGSHTHPGDRLFHIRIAEASGNPAYLLLVSHLLGRKYGMMFQRLQTLYSSKDMPNRSEHEHQLIMEALQARDAVAARRAMRAHMDSVVRIFSRSVPEQRH